MWLTCLINLFQTNLPEDGNGEVERLFGQALKALKKKMQREGTFREMKRRNHFEKP